MYQQPYYSRAAGGVPGEETGGLGGGLGGEEDDEYEERDLYGSPRPAFVHQSSRPQSRASFGRGAQPAYPPPRTSFSSPPPLRSNNSFEVGSVYSSERFSAPPDYPPYQRQTPQPPHPHPHPHPHQPYGYGYASSPRQSLQSPPGAYPDMYAPDAQAEHYWYAGAPPSVVSSGHTLTYDPYTGAGAAGAHAGSSPYSGAGGAYRAEEAPSYFGVSAPHHHPGAAPPASSHPHHHGRAGEALPNFPQWSRTWYGGHLSADGHAYTTVPPRPGSGTGWESETMTRSGGGGGGAQHHIYGRTGGISDPVKEERMRMLEKEFGKPKIRHGGGGGDDDDDDDRTMRGGEAGGSDDDDDDEADLPLGSVTSRGKLVTERPRWMLGARWLMGLAALAAFACGIGGALLIKPGKNDVPATRGSAASYVVYAASAITLVALVYLHVFRPCCCDPMRRLVKPGAGGSGGPGGALGGLVIPVLSAAGQTGKKQKMPRGKKGRMMMQQQAPPTVNLIVDPTLLGGGKKSRHGGDDSSDDDDDAGGYHGERLPGDARRKKRRKNGLGVVGNMQMQQRWRVARSTTKLLLIWDCVLSLVWLAAAIVAIAFQPKAGACKPGTGNGWCDFYNAAIACGVIFALTAWFTVYLGYRNLKVSSKPPRAI